MYRLASLLVCACIGLASAQGVTITQVGPGLSLYLDGNPAPLSTHLDERKALEAALSHGPGNYTIKRSDVKIVVKPPSVAYIPKLTPSERSAYLVWMRGEVKKNTNIYAATYPERLRWPSQAIMDANYKSWGMTP